MSWFVSGEHKRTDSRNLATIARLFQCLIFLGTVSAIMVGFYVSRTIPEFSKLILWAAIANALGLLGIAFVWERIIRDGKSK
jgi:hypothetical protein